MTAESNRSATLVWRNNDIAALSFRIHRRKLPDPVFAVIAASSSTTYNDKTIPEEGGIYAYAVSAVSGTDSSVISNELEATFPKIVLFSMPDFTVAWDTVARRSSVIVTDSANVEKGYRIYRSDAFGTERLMRVLPVTDPETRGQVVIVDTTPQTANAWYSYRAVMYSDTADLTLPSKNIFTLQPSELIAGSNPFLRVSSLRSSFPIKYSHWATLFGDSVFLGEGGAPSNHFTVIDVSNPDKPAFKGYVRLSNAVASYALEASQTLYSLHMGKDLMVYQHNSNNRYRLRFEAGDAKLISQGSSNGCLALMAVDDRTMALQCSGPNVRDDFNGVIGTLTFADSGEIWRTLASGYTRGVPGYFWGNRLFFHLDPRAGGSGDIIFTMIDFNFPSGAVQVFRTRAYRNFRLPSRIGGWLYNDTRLQNRKLVLMDTTRLLAYAFSDAVLEVYGLEKTTYADRNRVGLRAHRGSIRPNPRAFGNRLFPGNGWKGLLSLHDLTGRLLFTRRSEKGGGSIPLAPGLRKGIYLLRWESVQGERGSARVYLGP